MPSFRHLLGDSRAKGGFLVIGSHERIPVEPTDLNHREDSAYICQKGKQHPALRTGLSLHSPGTYKKFSPACSPIIPALTEFLFKRLSENMCAPFPNLFHSGLRRSAAPFLRSIEPNQRIEIQTVCSHKCSFEASEAHFRGQKPCAKGY
jgi:hypothetical protein